MDELRELMRNLGESFDQLSADIDKISEKIFEMDNADKVAPVEPVEPETWKEAVASVRAIERGECSEPVSDVVVPEVVGEDYVKAYFEEKLDGADVWTRADLNLCIGYLKRNGDWVRIQASIAHAPFQFPVMFEWSIRARNTDGGYDEATRRYQDEIREVVDCALTLQEELIDKNKQGRRIKTIGELKVYLYSHGDLVRVSDEREHTYVHRRDMNPYAIDGGGQTFYTSFNKSNVGEIIEFALKIHDQEKEKQYEF